MNNLDLEGLVLNWITLECIPPNPTHTHSALSCDKNSVVVWTFNMQSGSSLEVGHLHLFLGMFTHAMKASHLTPLSITGEESYMADVFSRAFQKTIFFTSNNNLNTYFKDYFPISQGNYFT